MAARNSTKKPADLPAPSDLETAVAEVTGTEVEQLVGRILELKRDGTFRFATAVGRLIVEWIYNGGGGG